MVKYMHIIKKCPLFLGIGESDIVTLFNCLRARIVEYKKDEFIFHAGEKLEYVGIVLSGRVHIVQEDYWGNRIILAAIEPGNLFAEAFSCALIEDIPVSVTASETAAILLIDYKKIITTCSASCLFHTGLIQNMLYILANKNIMLTRKIEHITKKTIREKVISYLSEQAVLAKTNTVNIPFNRQELADYLSVERSALSNTLCKMREEGVIAFHKNSFTMLVQEREKE